MPEHDFGWWSVLPPVVAIGLAIATRRVVLSLLSGVLIGAVILACFDPPRTTLDGLMLPITFAEVHLWSSLVDGDHLRVFAFTLLMGAMVGVITRGGGMIRVVDRLAPLASTRRGGQIITWILGLVVFFDDYANTLLLGNTMRPLCDRLKISREKLAYLVDSTAAPVSGLAFISTWIAGEIGYINDGFTGLNLASPANGFDIFFATIPYRFYVLFALLFVPLVALTGRDFGPMLTAERRCRNLAGTTKSTKPTDTEEQHIAGSHWLNAIAPIGVMIVVTLLLLLATGYKSAQAEELGDTLFNYFTSGDSYLALVYGALAGLLSAVLIAWPQRIMSPGEISKAAFDGAKSVMPALVILWLAWSLSGITKESHLGTGEFLGGLLQQTVSLAWMPTLVFILSSAVAFATGTSWGTMALLVPLVIRTTHAMLMGDDSAIVAANNPLMLATIGSVLAGAIFGDHCSPISDTTVLSSYASGCHHVAHVRTQMPYALVVAAVAIACGTLPVGFGLSPWMMLPIGIVFLALFMGLIGKQVDN